MNDDLSYKLPVELSYQQLTRYATKLELASIDAGHEEQTI